MTEQEKQISSESNDETTKIDRRAALKRIAGTAIAVSSVGLLSGMMSSCRLRYSDYYGDYYYYYYYSK